VGIAAELRTKLGAVIVGESPSGSASLFSSGTTTQLPYSDIELTVSGPPVKYLGQPYGTPLEPDVPIAYTIDDYINNRDPIMEWIAAQ
jgi:hypothetical protein